MKAVWFKNWEYKLTIQRLQVDYSGNQNQSRRQTDTHTQWSYGDS